MIRMLIPLAFAAALWASASFAVEEKILAQHGDWTQSVNVTSDGELYCNVYHVNHHGFFQLSSDGTDLAIAIVLTDLRAPSGLFDLDIDIDRNAWTLEDVDSHTDEGNNTHLLFEFHDEYDATDFLRDFQRGKVLSIPIPNGPDRQWSLNGSAASLQAFRDCILKLQPTF